MFNMCTDQRVRNTVVSPGVQWQAVALLEFQSPERKTSVLDYRKKKKTLTRTRTN